MITGRSNCPHRAYPDHGWGFTPRPWRRSGAVRAGAIAIACVFASSTTALAQNLNAATHELLNTLSFCLQKQNGPVAAKRTAAATGWQPATAQDIERYFALFQDWRYAKALKTDSFGKLALRKTGLKAAQLEQMPLDQVVLKLEETANRPEAATLSNLVGETEEFVYLVTQDEPHLFAVISFAQSTANIQKRGWYQYCSVLGTDQSAAEAWFYDSAQPVDLRPQPVPLTATAELRAIGQNEIDAPSRLNFYRVNNAFMRDTLGLDTQLAAYIKTSLSISVPSELQSEATK